MSIPPVYLRTRVHKVDVHIGVGFCVAYPYLVGNAKAWNVG